MEKHGNIVMNFLTQTFAHAPSSSASISGRQRIAVCRHLAMTLQNERLSEALIQLSVLSETDHVFGGRLWQFRSWCWKSE